MHVSVWHALMHATNAAVAAWYKTTATAIAIATARAVTNAAFVAFIRQQISIVSYTHTHTSYIDIAQ